MSQIKGKQLADAPNGVTTGKINDLAVTTAKIADANVTTVKILDANITTAKLAAGVLSADAAGRAKMAAGYFDLAQVGTTFAAAAIALSKLEEAVIQADGGQAHTANQSMGGFKLTNVGTPTVGTDAANKDYVDNAIAGLAWKDSVRVATTANTALTGLLTIDGVTLVANDRILVKNNTAPAENGIWVAASGAWTRATDFDTQNEALSGTVFVEEGSTQANTSWTMTTDAPITIGTTGLTWVQFAASVALVAGAGLLATGNTWSVELAPLVAGLEFDAGGDGGRLKIKIPAVASVLLLNGSGEITVQKDGKTISGASNGILRAAHPVGLNKFQTPSVAAGEGSTTGLTLGASPAEAVGSGGPIPHVRVLVNGIGQRLGNGTKTGVDCYFSADGGTTARTYTATVAGDTLYWNATTAGFGLDATDVVDMDYNSIS